MSDTRNYDEANVIRIISRNNSVQVNADAHIVEVVRNATDVGNSTWGKIDYLRKIHGYSVNFVDRLSHKSAPKKTVDEAVYNKGNKTAKREAKLNMAAMVKSTMRRVKNK